MKSKKIITLLALLFPISILAGCGSKNEQPVSSEQGPITTSEVSPTTSEAPAHVHNYVNKSTDAKYLASAADCTHPAKYYYSCSCGEAWTETFESGEALGHSWKQEIDAKYLASEATCTSRAMYYYACERCHEASKDTYGVGDCIAHDYSKLIVGSDTLASAADCTHPAYYYLSCKYCGAIDHEHKMSVGDPLGHDWEDKPDSTYLVSAATCLDRAVYHSSCARCHEAHPTRTFAYGDPLGHEFTVYASNNDATCTENGTETAHCNHAGCAATDTRVVENSKLAHNLIEEIDNRYLVSAATCEDDAVYNKHCADCNFISEETFTVEHTALGHEYNPITGHCTHLGCDESNAIPFPINYGDGSFSGHDWDEEEFYFFEENETKIFELEFTGTAPYTNFLMNGYSPACGSTHGRISYEIYNENGQKYDYVCIYQYSGTFVFEGHFESGCHYYMHVINTQNISINFHPRYATTDYSGFRYVARKYATCLTPQIEPHVVFDQSETTGTWLNGDCMQEKTFADFYKGEASGTGHSFTHYAASAATTTSPALKEHWYCENCGAYFLDPDSDEEVEYEELYDNYLYGYVLECVYIPGRGYGTRVRITVDQGEEPVATAYVNYGPTSISDKRGHLVFEDGTSEVYRTLFHEANNHVITVFFHGIGSLEELEDLNPKAFYWELN